MRGWHGMALCWRSYLQQWLLPASPPWILVAGRKRVDAVELLWFVCVPGWHLQPIFKWRADNCLRSVCTWHV